MTKRETKGEHGDEEVPGLALRVLRAVLDLSQDKLARRLGISGGTLSQMENGSISRRELLRAIRAMALKPVALDCTVEYLVRIRAARLDIDLDEENQEQWQRRSQVALFAQWIEEMTLEILAERDRQLIAHEESRQAEILIEHLRWLPHASRLALVEESPRYHFWRLVLQLCDKSLQATADSAQVAREWAELAVLAARHLPAPAGWKARVLGYATVHFANALRVQGELKAADRAYEEGLGLWKQGGRDDLEQLNEARVLGFGASLRRAQRRFGEALDLLEQALTADGGELTPHLLINKARLLRELGNLEAALAVLQEAEPLLGEVDDPRLVFVVQLNFVDHLSLLGSLDQASRKLPDVWRLAEDAAGELDRVRLVWVHGRVAAGTGNEGEGIASLEQVRSTFSARRMAYDAALATLELAALRLRLNQPNEVRALAREMAPIFDSQEVHREALAALALFCRAVEQELLTLDLVDRLVLYLHQARHNPELRFNPERLE